MKKSRRTLQKKEISTEYFLTQKSIKIKQNTKPKQELEERLPRKKTKHGKQNVTGLIPSWEDRKVRKAG